ncbi:MAG: hypothetical protein ACFFE5_10195 [Candidatus Thorarchaeota archaeon]
MVVEFKEFFYVFQKEQAKIESIKPSLNIPFMGIDMIRRKNISTNKEIDPIEKKRALKRWKQSFSYFSHHPEKFRFGIKNLK